MNPRVFMRALRTIHSGHKGCDIPASFSGSRFLSLRYENAILLTTI